MDTSGHMTYKKRYISISKRPVDTKLDRMLAQTKEPQTLESCVLLFSLSREVTAHNGHMTQHFDYI